jgi:hypothetical protein
MASFATPALSPAQATTTGLWQPVKYIDQNCKQLTQHCDLLCVAAAPVLLLRSLAMRLASARGWWRSLRGSATQPIGRRRLPSEPADAASPADATSGCVHLWHNASWRAALHRVGGLQASAWHGRRAGFIAA